MRKLGIRYVHNGEVKFIPFKAEIQEALDKFLNSPEAKDHPSMQALERAYMLAQAERAANEQ